MSWAPAVLARERSVGKRGIIPATLRRIVKSSARLTALLLDVSPWDPFTHVIVFCVLIAVTIVAAYLPARRAVSVDPVVALRSA